MSNILDKLESKIDKQTERLDDINATLTEIKVDLRDHMRRTQLNEEAVKLLTEHVNEVTEKAEKRLEYVEKLKDRLHFLGWLFSGLLGLIQALSYFKVF